MAPHLCSEQKSIRNTPKRIGVSYQGLMEFPYGSPFTADGQKQPKLHTKVYQFIQDDTHHKLKSREGNPEGGLLCQDCHATTYPPQDGYLLTTRGNPFGNAVREGDKVVVHSASGLDFEVPGCQQITTVIAPDGEMLIHNKIWRTPPNTEGGGAKGQRGIDMAPAAPHTTASQARECTSCHATSKALGYGTHDGRYLRQYTGGIYADIMNEKGQLVTKTAKFQISPIPDLPMDLDQVVTREGEQVQSVGQH